MSNFTTGIWKYIQSLGVVYSEDTSSVIASVRGAGTGSCFCLTPEGQANARLIADAPKLYALAESLAALPDEQCMIYPLIHDARKLITRITDKEAHHDY